MASTVKLGILGPLELVVDGVEVPLGGRKQRTLLGLLAVSAGREVTVDSCVEALWGDSVPEGADHTLHTYVSNLRRLFVSAGDALRLERLGDRYRLQVGEATIDLVSFESEVRQGKQALATNPARASEILRQALKLWRGPPLGELGHEPWALPTTTRLNALLLETLLARIDADLRLGRHRELVGELESLVGQHPLDEGLWARFMTALSRSGRQADALRAYRRVRKVLGEELGIEPGPELVALEDRILMQDPSVAPPSRRETRLPAVRSPLIGREPDLERVIQLLGDYRAVTLIGPGGVGKTVLAVGAARRSVESFEGTWFVDLLEVSEGPDLVVSVARSLGLELPSASRALVDLGQWVGDRRLLLILDNCEHRLPEVREFVERLVTSCPALVFLATSRESLAVTGEHLHSVSPLETDEAVRLFDARARAARSDFDLDSNLPTVGEICSRLDGLPLAIELAAARITHLSASEILERLDSSFRLLKRQGAPDPRHRTLEAAVDWSYQLLQEPEQQLLRATTTFSGSFDVAAIAAVAGWEELDALDVVGSLVEKSVLLAEVGPGGQTKYRLLAPVRAVISQRVEAAGERDLLQKSHAEHYLAVAIALPPHPPDTHPWVPFMVRDPAHPVDAMNRLAAVEWLLANGRLTEAARLKARMMIRWRQRYIDAEARLLERDDVAESLADPEERAAYLLASAENALALGRFDDHVRFARQILAFGDEIHPHTTAEAAGLLAVVLALTSPEECREILERSRRRLPPESRALAGFLSERAVDERIYSGQFDQAVEMLRALAAEGSLWARFELPLVLHILGRSDELDRSVDDIAEVSWVSTHAPRVHIARALAHISAGDPSAAERSLIKAGELAQRHPWELLERDTLAACAAAAGAVGEWKRACSLLAGTQGLLRSPASLALYLHCRDLAGTRVPKREIAQLREAARGLRPDEVLARELERLRRKHGSQAQV